MLSEGRLEVLDSEAQVTTTIRGEQEVCVVVALSVVLQDHCTLAGHGFVQLSDEALQIIVIELRHLPSDRSV
jgi:hypothetical protein